MVADHPLSQAADRVSDSTRCKLLSTLYVRALWIFTSLHSPCRFYSRNHPCRLPTVGSRRPPAPYYYRWSLSAIAKWCEH